MLSTYHNNKADRRFEGHIFLDWPAASVLFLRNNLILQPSMEIKFLTTYGEFAGNKNHQNPPGHQDNQFSNHCLC